MMWLTISAVGGISTIGVTMHTQQVAELAMWLIAGVAVALGLGTLLYAYLRPLANVPAVQMPDAMARVEEGRGGVRKDPAALVPAANPPPTNQSKVP